VARAIESGALAALAPRLAELGHPAEALAAARAIESASSRFEALAALAPHLTAPLLREALEVARAIGYEWYRSRALAPLALRLAELSHPAEALEVARAIESEKDRSGALAALAPHLGPTERDQALREALAAARAIESASSRFEALAALAPHLGPTERDQALREFLEAARAIGDKWSRSQALAPLAPLALRLAELSHPAEALEVARAIESASSRSQALAALAPRLTEPLLREALEAARAIESASSRFEALAALAPHLGPAERDQALREALEAARAIESASSRFEALAVLAPHLGPTERDQALREALEAARAIGDKKEQSEALAALAPRLTPPLLGEALEAARAIWDERYRSQALAALAPQLQLAELTPATRSPLWSKTLHLLATRSRRDLLTDLIALVPLLTAWGGQRGWLRPLALSKTWGGGGRNRRLVAGGRGEGDPRLPCRAHAGGYRRLAFMMLDADIVAVSPSNVDRVLSDIDMPRMDGIQLVAYIKQDPRLKAFPVMIVSYKDREEDRIRGLDAGANCYLTKNSFHDQTFLDTVVDLIGEAEG